MKKLVLAALFVMVSASLVFAGAVKTYQVTGPVLEVKDDAIVVEKGKEKWEIAKDKDTKVTGDVKVGSKVTIMYRMTAASIESKDAGKKAEKKEEKKDTKKKDDAKKK